MRSKAPLALMEQVVMVLVFALAAALCVSCFVTADRLSRRNAVRDEAVVAAQNAAETIKGCRGDYEQAATLLNGTLEHGILELCADEEFCIVVTPENSDDPLLGKAKVEACAVRDGETLFALTVFWQEVGTRG